MKDRKRLHRGDPARTAPVRNFSKLYSRSNSVDGSVPAKSVQPDAPGDAADRTPPAEGVELAYGVIKKHIAEGLRDDGGFSNQPNTTPHPRHNLHIHVIH